MVDDEGGAVDQFPGGADGSAHQSLELGVMERLAFQATQAIGAARGLQADGLVLALGAHGIRLANHQAGQGLEGLRA